MSSFHGDHLLLGMGLAPKYGAQWDSLGDTNFSSVCGYPLEIASWLIMGTHICFPNLMQELCLVWSYAGLMRAVACVCLCVNHFVSGRHSSHSLWLLQSFNFLIRIVPRTLKKGSYEEIYLGHSISLSLTIYCPLVDLCISSHLL